MVTQYSKRSDSIVDRKVRDASWLVLFLSRKSDDFFPFNVSKRGVDESHQMVLVG